MFFCLSIHFYSHITYSADLILKKDFLIFFRVVDFSGLFYRVFFRVFFPALVCLLFPKRWMECSSSTLWETNFSFSGWVIRPPGWSLLSGWVGVDGASAHRVSLYLLQIVYNIYIHFNYWRDCLQIFEPVDKEWTFRTSVGISSRIVVLYVQEVLTQFISKLVLKTSWTCPCLEL